MTGTAHAEGSKVYFDEFAPRTCAWDASTSTLAMATKGPVNESLWDKYPETRYSQRGHVGLDVDPVDGRVASCGEQLNPPPLAADVHAVNLSVGSGLTYVWVHPPDPARSDWMPTWTIAPAADAKNPFIVVIVSYDAFAAPPAANVIASATGLDLDGNGTQDVTVNAAHFTVEVAGERASGLVDLRAVPWPASTYAYDNGYGRRIRLGGTGDSTFYGPSVGADLDVRLGAGNDHVDITGGVENEIDTYGGNDTITVRGRPSSVDARDDEHVQVFAGAGDDTVTTGTGNDYVKADGPGSPLRGIDNGNDHVSTGAGDDDVDGGYGADVIDTGQGDDEISSHAEGGRLDGGPDSDLLNLFGGTRSTSATCGTGRDEAWIGGNRSRMRATSCEKVDPRPAPDYETGYDPILRPTTLPGDPTRHDGRMNQFADTGTWGLERCTWDPATGTISRVWGGAGDLHMSASGGMPYGNKCGETVVDKALVQRIVVSVASPRATLYVSPRATARGPRIEFRPAPIGAGTSPVVVISDDRLGRGTPRYNVRATRDGLDLDNDGELDVAVFAEHWNVHLSTERHYGRFDLREVPTLPHEVAYYDLGSQRNVVFGPTSGPDVMLNTRGTNARHELLEGQSDEIVLGPGDDDIKTYGGWDIIDSGAGNDYVDASIGNDVVHAGPGDDQVKNDVNRVERWARGDDRTWLGTGNDYAESGLGEDVTFGGDGDDIIIDEGGLGGMVDAGAGNDEVLANSTGRPILVRCGAGADIERIASREPANATYVGCERRYTPPILSDWRHQWWMPSESGERSWR